MCWFSIAKYLLFAFNFVLWAGGIAVVGIGIYLLVGPSDAVVDVGGVSFYTAGASILIFAGSVAFIMGFLGCCGAMKESTCMLGLYFTGLLAVLILEVGVGIWAAVEYDSVDDLIEEQLYEYDLSGDAQSDEVMTYMNMEQSFHCCGKNNTCFDWLDAGQSEPLGCNCSPGDPHCKLISETSCSGEKFDEDYNYIYNQDCTTAMTTYVQDNMTLIIGIGLGIGLVEIIGMIFSICMCCAIKEKQGYA